MRVVLHQPYFLPWLGYFSKLHFSDAFIVLDNVNFRKRHYFDRTKIINMNGEVHWIGLPVGENFQRKCRDVIVREDSFKTALITTLTLSYAKAFPHFEKEIGPVTQILETSIMAGKDLVDTNMDIVLGVLDHLEIQRPQLYFSSAIGDVSDATERVLMLCKHVHADEVLIGGGSSTAVHDWRRIKAAGISIFIQDYMAQHPQYSQTRRRRLPFQAGLSLVDALFNVGRQRTRDFVANASFNPKPLYL
jgi:WbqC-like protein family